MSAAEVSADLHGSYLAKELGDCQLFGMGGEKMRVAGVDVRIDITDKSSIGIIEALRYIPSHLITLHKLKNMLKQEKPDALILIDAQGLNMPLASYAKQLGIKTIYYIAPQEWLWGTKKGLNKVIKNIDLIISIFKKEDEIFRSAGGNSVYYGHPLLDIVKPSMTKDQFTRKFGLDPSKKIIALCPGSRKHELKDLFSILIETANKLGNAQFVMPIASSKLSGLIETKASASKVDIKVIEGYSNDVLAHSDLVIAKSGTIVLESVILGTPVIMFYKLSRLTYLIGKKILNINLKYYSMPNILADKMIVPELVMERATAENIYKEAQKILENPGRYKEGLAQVKSLLGDEGAIKKATQKIIEFINLG